MDPSHIQLDPAKQDHLHRFFLDHSSRMDPDDQEFLSPSDLPGCLAPMSFSCISTDRKGGYAERRGFRFSEDSFLQSLVAGYSNALEWEPSARVFNIVLAAGEADQDYEVLERDLEKLPAKWRDLIEYY